MRTANLPISYSLESTGGAGTMKQICNAVNSDGGQNLPGVPRVFHTTSNNAVGSGIIETMIGIRLKPNAFEHTVEIDEATIASTSGANARRSIVMNPTFVGTPTFNRVDQPNSILQVSRDYFSIVAGTGIEMRGGSFSNNQDQGGGKFESKLRIGKDLQGNVDEIFLVASLINSASENFQATMNVTEKF